MMIPEMYLFLLQITRYPEVQHSLGGGYNSYDNNLGCPYSKGRVLNEGEP
jgi:hypothetical protein